eukprot:TRINITY_DN722_c2_g1_i1.p1 TRINITY_DN722_c2_g1~~TRINITY_DN722_c2_g1_i1.p1  ORF type:complete len:514 (-),score=68.56 TRINITY_DN722_c2_g1_i1:111-1544(-)
MASALWDFAHKLGTTSDDIDSTTVDAMFFSNNDNSPHNTPIPTCRQRVETLITITPADDPPMTMNKPLEGLSLTPRALSPSLSDVPSSPYASSVSSFDSDTGSFDAIASSPPNMAGLCISTPGFPMNSPASPATSSCLRPIDLPPPTTHSSSEGCLYRPQPRVLAPLASHRRRSLSIVERKGLPVSSPRPIPAHRASPSWHSPGRSPHAHSLGVARRALRRTSTWELPRQYSADTGPHGDQATRVITFPQPVAQGLPIDYKHPLILPTLDTEDSSGDGIPRVDAKTVSQLLDGSFKDRLHGFYIVDCRYTYEFKGGHITGAVNLCTEADVEQLFEKARTEHGQRTAIILHCEFSSERGPKLARYLRALDRELHAEMYPQLFYPEVYILEKGYHQYYLDFPDYCRGGCGGYVPMKHPSHADELRFWKSECQRIHEERTGRFRRSRSESMIARPQYWSPLASSLGDSNGNGSGIFLSTL